MTNNNEQINEWRYTQDEMDCFMDYVENNIGHVETVYHEIVSDRVHMDVLVVAPCDEIPCYRLITMGAGAYRMNVPEDYDENYYYAEYAFMLPKKWPVYEMEDEKNYWPLHFLKRIARMPSDCDDWFCLGHTLQANDDFSPVHESTAYNGFAMVPFGDKNNEMTLCEMPDGRIINIYRLLPLYDEELQYAMEEGVQSLMEYLPDEAIMPEEELERENCFSD